MRGRCIWLDGSPRKACRVLRARLALLGYEIRCRSNLPDWMIDAWARRDACIVVTSDREASERYGWILVPNGAVMRKSARDLATLITRLALSRHRAGDEPRGAKPKLAWSVRAPAQTPHGVWAATPPATS